jgi:hypothetical protein
VTLSATSWQWRCNHAVFNRAKWNLQQLSDLTPIVTVNSDPPQLKLSDLKYVLCHQGGSEQAKEEAHA